MLIPTLKILALHQVKFLGAGSDVLNLSAVYFGWLLGCAPWFLLWHATHGPLGMRWTFCTLSEKDVVTAKPSRVATEVIPKAPLGEHIPWVHHVPKPFGAASKNQQSYWFPGCSGGSGRAAGTCRHRLQPGDGEDRAERRKPDFILTAGQRVRLWQGREERRRHPPGLALAGKDQGGERQHRAHPSPHAAAESSTLLPVPRQERDKKSGGES